MRILLPCTVRRSMWHRILTSSCRDIITVGPELPFSSLLFAAEKIPLLDIIAILGRIDGVNSIADWKNLPSTKLPNVSIKDPPQWLPRKAFKVNIRKAKVRRLLIFLVSSMNFVDY